ncbi:hypothetical protein PSPO01_08952 [Paraphaeosphaeria sporulosa]
MTSATLRRSRLSYPSRTYPSFRHQLRIPRSTFLLRNLRW